MADRPFARIPLLSGSEIALWREDALSGLVRRLPPAGVDVVVTSPPYNLGIRYASSGDRRPRPEYLAWIGQLSDAVGAVLAERGSFFLNIGGTPKDPWLPWDVAREVGRVFVLQNVLHWVKSIAIGGSAAGRAAGLTRDLAVGHYKPVRSERFVHGAHEYVFHFTRRGRVALDRLAIGVPYQDASNVTRWNGGSGGLRCRGNTWFLPYPTIRTRARDRPHPATFPQELPEWCLRLHGVDRIRTAVDPFVGIGSSAVAAARLGIGFVGFDVDAGYLRRTVERVRASLGSPAEKGAADADRAVRRARSRTRPSGAGSPRP